MATSPPPLPPPPPFDLQAYVSRYDPHSETYLQRLLFLAHHFHDEAARGGDGGDVARRAFEMAVARMKRSGNHRRYVEEYGAVTETPAGTEGAASFGVGGGVPELAGTGSLPGSASARTRSDSSTRRVIQNYLDYDAEFIRRSQIDAQARAEVMEGRLAAAQSHLMKESIRTALLALAEFHRERGELREAWRRVARSREYCASGRQHAQVCLLLVELSADLGEWSTVRDTVARAEHAAAGDPDDALFRPKLRTAQALACLAEGRYSEAARGFTLVSPELTSQFHTVVSAEDLATYGGLLGLATMDRKALHEAVIDGPFKGRLELVPAMRDALCHYSRADYGRCLSLLQTGALRRDLLLDIHLSPHVPILLDMIRSRCIAQYFQPYSSLSLKKMGNVFGCAATEMEEVVAKLLSNSGADGVSLGEGVRIDALKKTLSVEGSKSVGRKVRRRARVKAAKLGVQFARNAEGMILRMACIENGIAIHSTGWRNRSGHRSRDGDSHGGGPDRMMGPAGMYESDDSVSDDAMDTDNHMVNPNELNPNEF